jgi:hypothetical protein
MLLRGKSPLWCVEQDGAVIVAQLENCGALGIQFRLWWNGQLYFAELYRTQDLALMASEQLRIGFHVSTAIH